jgi:hypothetical protein
MTLVAGVGRHENFACVYDDCLEAEGRDALSWWRNAVAAEDPDLNTSLYRDEFSGRFGRVEDRATEDCLDVSDLVGVILPPRGVVVPDLVVVGL